MNRETTTLRRPPRKVLHIIDSEGLYGAEVMLLNLAGEQIKLGFEPTIASIGESSIGEKDLEKEARRRGLNLKKVRMRPGPNIYGALKLLVWAKKENFQLLHSHGYKGNILFGLIPRKLRRLPLVTTLHGYTSTRGFSKLRLYEWLDARSLKFIDAVVLVSQGMVGHPRLNGPRGVTYHVVPNGIPLDLSSDALICPSSEVIDRELSDFCSKGFTIGSIGRLSTEKGYQYLIRALHLLVQKGIDARLVIIGEGYERSLLDGLAGKLDLTERVSLPGYRDRAKRYLPCFNVFTISSLTEGLPITLLEAMQARVPIVATRVGGIPEVLQSGQAGLLVDPGQPQSLAEAIIRLYENGSMAQQLVEMAYQNVVGRFSAQSMALGYLRVYETVIDQNKSN